MGSCSLLRSSCLWNLVPSVVLAGCLTACGHPRAQGPGSPPDALDDGWQVSSLEAEDMAPERLAELEQRIESKELRAPDSLLIARHGKLVYERYWNGFNRDKPHDLRSATKSITSLLTGVAVGQQLVPEAWIRESTASERTLGDSKYGYLWWLNTFGISGTPVEAWFARGNGGQYILVFPSLELVATFTGSFYDEQESDLPIQLVGQFVLTSALHK